MLYIDYVIKERYINETFKNITRNEDALDTLNKESFNLRVQKNLLNEVYLDLLAFLDKLLISGRKYNGPEIYDYKEILEEFLKNIKMKIHETNTNLHKATHIEVSLFNCVDVNEDLIIYKRFIKFNKFPKYLKQKNIDDYKLFLSCEFDDCFGAGGLLTKIKGVITDLSDYVELFEQQVIDSKSKLEEALSNCKYFTNDLPVLTRGSSFEMLYSFLLTKLLNGLKKIYNEGVGYVTLN